MESDLGRPDSPTALAERLERCRLPSPARRTEIRVQAGASLRDVASALHVDPMTVHRWEKGTTPRPAQAIAYRELLERLEALVTR